MVRSVLNLPAPGDIRNAMVSLSEADPILRDLFQHRLVSNRLDEFNGVAFGNLFLAALAQMTGSFERAILEMQSLLKPAATLARDPGQHPPLRRAGGRLLALRGGLRAGPGQARHPARLPARRGRGSLSPGARQPSAQADLITIGPGSLFTTVLACLVMPGVVQAIAEARARGACTVYVCNTTTQPGQTDGFTVYDHVAEIASYLGRQQLDYALVNTGLPPAHVAERHRRDGLIPLG